MKTVLSLAATGLACNVHLAAQNGSMEQLAAPECDLCASNASGFNALFYAAQAPNPYEVSKFLLEQKCQLRQENIANLQPIHALLANDKVTSKEIVDTIGLYRINGNEVFVSAYPVHSVFDFQIRNYLIGFGPDAYIAKNSGLTETDVVAIKSAMTSPLNDVFDKVLVKSSNELLAKFDARHAEKDAKRQLEIEKLKDEVFTLSSQLESNQADYDGRIEKHEKDRVEMMDKLANINTQLDREFDRHATVEAQLNDEKVGLERVILKTHEERDELIKEHSQELQNLENKITQLNEEIESMSKDDVSQKLRIKTLEDEITSAGEQLAERSTEVDDCIEQAQIEKRACDEKISENLEQIEKLTNDKEELTVELENQRDLVAKALTEAEASQNKLSDLTTDVQNCQEALKKCPEFTEAP